MFPKIFLFLGLMVLCLAKGHAQKNPDKIYDSSIHSILIHPLNKPLAMPVVVLNEGSPLQVSFDDFKADYQDYNYAIELMNADWTPSILSSFDYVKGFNQIKINSFSVSSMASQHYYHYQ